MDARELQTMRNLGYDDFVDLIERQAAENASLKTVMAAAAEEIHAHWDAHCDADGYGPANLMRRLEEGIAVEYGYTAGRFAEQEKRIAALEAATRRWMNAADKWLATGEPASPEESRSIYEQASAALAAQPAQTEAVAKMDREATWWTLVMGAAASIEDAANCLRDPDAKRQAEGAATHYRNAARKLAASPTPPSPAPVLTQAAADALAERRRQVEVECFDQIHDDDAHDPGELAAAGSAYALAAADAANPYSKGDGDFMTNPPIMWPWDRQWWKPGEPRRMLVKSAALLLAEIERLDRAAAKEQP